MPDPLILKSWTIAAKSANFLASEETALANGSSFWDSFIIFYFYHSLYVQILITKSQPFHVLSSGSVISRSSIWGESL